MHKKIKQPTSASQQETNRARDVVLDDREAEAGAPDHESVCGEEDPGAALESLVRQKVRPQKDSDEP